MTGSHVRPHQRWLHPIHGVLLAASVTLFFAGLLSDWAYAASYQIQWSNFASWLIAGGLISGGVALLWAIIDLLRARHRGGHAAIYPGLLLASWLLGFLNALIHARDAWATMPLGLVLSVLVVLLSGASVWIGFVKFGVGGGR